MSSRTDELPPAPLPEQSSSGRRVLRGIAATPLTLGALVAAALITFPILGVLASLLQPASDLWPLMAETVLPRYTGNTLLLALLVAAGVTAIGVPAALAWLSASSVCGFTPSSAATTRTTTSTAEAPRARIAENAA